MNRFLLHAAAQVIWLSAAPASADGGVDERTDEKPITIAVEAEHYVEQRESDVRRWYVTSEGRLPEGLIDGDPPHFNAASGGAYVEILPDTRRTHADELVDGENFSNEPGKLAILDYEVNFPSPGKYYVWVRAFSTGSEDNGIHVGLDGEWPESGRRLQWCEGKQNWRWESRQRTLTNHCGEPHRIFLEVPDAGTHVVSFSMREDGFEFDKFVLTTIREFPRPDGVGPEAVPGSIAEQ